MKYMLLLYGAAEAGPAPETAEFGEMLAEYGHATERMRSDGVLLDSSPLQPPSAATTVTVRQGQTQITDGPFAEIKEMLGGYYLIESDDLDQALRYAATIPAAKYGKVEVRPLMQMGGAPS
jgi:hypothetical protein